MICSFVWNEIHIIIITTNSFVFFFFLLLPFLSLSPAETSMPMRFHAVDRRGCHSCHSSASLLLFLLCVCYLCLLICSLYQLRSNMSSASTVASAQQNEVEESIRRIQTHKGVQGFIITSNDGKNRRKRDETDRFDSFPLGSFVRSNIDNSTTMSLTGLLRTLADKAKSCVRDLDPQNDLTFLRIRTKKQEILVAPGQFVLLESFFVKLVSFR